VLKKGPSMAAIPKEARNFPIVSPLLPGGARSCVMIKAVGTKATSVRAWKILIG